MTLPDDGEDHDGRKPVPPSTAHCLHDVSLSLSHNLPFQETLAQEVKSPNNTIAHFGNFRKDPSTFLQKAPTISTPGLFRRPTPISLPCSVLQSSNCGIVVLTQRYTTGSCMRGPTCTTFLKFNKHPNFAHSQGATKTPVR